MAQKLNGKGARKPRAKKKAAESLPPTDHNITQIRKVAKPFFEKLHRLHDQKESRMGEFMADIKALIEEAANDIGVPRAIMREAFADDRRELKRQARVKEMEPGERDAYEALRAALGHDTPMGEFAGRKAEEAAGESAN